MNERTGSPVLLYDGTCGFCARSVRFILARESPARRAHLRFAPLEGGFGQRLRTAHPALQRVNSVIWFDPTRDDLLVRSAAGLAVLRHLGGPWRLIAALGAIIPRALRDAVYDAIARNRHRISGEDCLVPKAEERGRFLA